jgi:hypothetical protein
MRTKGRWRVAGRTFSARTIYEPHGPTKVAVIVPQAPETAFYETGAAAFPSCSFTFVLCAHICMYTVFLTSSPDRGRFCVARALLPAEAIQEQKSRPKFELS